MQLFGKTLKELQEITQELGFPKFTAKQITDWLYKKNISDIEEMTNLSKKLRDKLKQNYEIGLREHINVQESTDGTKKYLFPVGENQFVEAAYIPEKERATLCVSTQVGCKLGCKFCMTGRQGFQKNLTAGEILNQIKSLPEFDKLTNIVYMGMGEPMDNIDEVLKSLEILNYDYGFAMSPRRITVSTTGLIGGLKRFLNESECNLALSVHTPFLQEREKIMPVQKSNSLLSVLNVIKKHTFKGKRRFSVEYILFKGFNDSQKHVNELTKILHGAKCRVNIIRFHEIPGVDLKRTTFAEAEMFKDRFKEKGIIATVRKSRGQDIDAACGLLSTNHKNK